MRRSCRSTLMQEVTATRKLSNHASGIGPHRLIQALPLSSHFSGESPTTQCQELFVTPYLVSWGLTRHAGRKPASSSLITTSHFINLQISASFFFFSLTDVLNIHNTAINRVSLHSSSHPQCGQHILGPTSSHPPGLTRGRSLTTLVSMECLHTHAFLPSFCFVMDRVTGLASFFA